MAQELRNFSFLTARPNPDERLFTSEGVERAIERTAAMIADPELRRMFEQCLPNTLDTTVDFRQDENGRSDTFVATGDIPAMWLRDSTNQVWPYLRFVGEDDELRQMFAGLIFRQAECILIDPYANAFKHPHMQNPPTSDMWGLGDGWDERVWERKYELDSLAAYLRLINGYYEQTGDSSIFTDRVLQAIRMVLEVIASEQEEITADEDGVMYRALRPDGTPMPKFSNDGEGPANKKVGLSRNLYRPSDDEAEYPYLIPANAMASVALGGLAKVLQMNAEPALANDARMLGREIDAAIQEYGIVDDPQYGKIYAYEVDGDGHYELMDDPNVPSLLSLPYLGYCSADDPVFKNTLRYILGGGNRYFYRGAYEGQGSPHTPPGYFWPIATIMRAMVSDDDAEITSCLKILKETHDGTYFMHEGIDVNDPANYTRPWFGWANSLFGELILDIAERKPALLGATF